VGAKSVIDQLVESPLYTGPSERGSYDNSRQMKPLPVVTLYTHTWNLEPLIKDFKYVKGHFSRDTIVSFAAQREPDEKHIKIVQVGAACDTDCYWILANPEDEDRLKKIAADMQRRRVSKELNP